MKTITLGLVLMLTSCFSASVFATDYVQINNAATLKWQLDSAGKAWFRNLNSYNSLVLGCC